MPTTNDNAGNESVWIEARVLGLNAPPQVVRPSAVSVVRKGIVAGA